MDVRRLADPAEFLAAAEPLLLVDEARHNLLLGIAGTLRDQPERYPDFAFWLVENGGEVVGAALRTAPHPVVVARPATDGALAALVDAIQDDLPGVAGALPEADDFAALWCAATGAQPRREMEHGVYRLEHVLPATPVGGAMRDATEADLPLLVEWFCAFVDEADPAGGSDETAARATLELRLAAADSGFALWEDDGPVSMAGHGGPTPNGVRIGPVYTPPELRGRGYASGLVAELSARLLEGGRRFCFLFTDLANPTANRIYRRIGYEQVCEAARIVFEPGR